MALEEAVERITYSMEDCVERIFNLAGCTLGLGLTGGHDSRLILSALAYKNIPFDPIRWDEGNFNDQAVRRLCAVLEVTPSISESVKQFSLHAGCLSASYRLHC